MGQKRTGIKVLGITALLVVSALLSTCAGRGSTVAAAATMVQTNRWMQAATSANKVVTDGFPRRGTVTSYSLNVRKKAGTDSDIVEVLYKNTIVEIQEVTKTKAGNYWYKIAFVQNGKNISGYVSSTYIKAGASLITPTPTPEEIIVHEDAIASIPRVHKGCSDEEREARIGYSEAFWVTEEGTIYLLDTYGKRIWKENGKNSGYIPIADSGLPADMMYKDGEFYIYDEGQQEFEIYGEDGTLLFVAPIVLKDDYVKGFENLQDHVVLVTYGGDVIFPIRELGITYVAVDMAVQKTVTGDWSFSEYIGTDAKENAYFSYTKLLDGSSVLAGEIFIGMWDKDNALVKKIALPMTELRYLPKRWVQIMEDGTIYLFLPLEQSFEIREIKDEKAYLSSIDEITKDVALVEEEYNKMAKSAKKLKVFLDREECRERALSIVEYKWTLSKKNTENYNEKKITLPRYIEAIAKLHEGEADWTEELTGIPYCWGGFGSQYNTQAAQRFDTQLAKNYTAGNINTSYYTTEKSAGLDCSGYAGTVYGIKEKVNTRMLMGVGFAVTSPEKLNSMDMLLYPGEHVILYYGKLTDGVLLVTEVAVRDGKASVHPKRINELIVQPGYQMRQVW